jgi:hypothetical protein
MDFLINYAQSVEECFTQVATFLLPVLGLRMLTAIRHPHEKAMSSWIPDWSENPPLDFRHFNEPLGAERGQPVSSPGPPDEQKHTTRPFSYRVNKTRQELLVVGLQHAKIVERSQEFRFINVDDAKKQMEGLYNCNRLGPSQCSVPRWNPRCFLGILGIAGNFLNTAPLDIYKLNASIG